MVVKVIYNLLYYQVILQISCNFSRAERNTIIMRSCFGLDPSETILGRIIEYFDESELYSDDSEPFSDDDSELFSDDACKPSTSSSASYARVDARCIEQRVRFLNNAQNYISD